MRAQRAQRSQGGLLAAEALPAQDMGRGLPCALAEQRASGACATTLGALCCAERAVPRAQSLVMDLQKVTRDHREMRCYKLGLGLDTFRMVALTKHFAKLEAHVLQAAYARCVSP